MFFIWNWNKYFVSFEFAIKWCYQDVKHIYLFENIFLILFLFSFKTIIITSVRCVRPKGQKVRRRRSAFQNRSRAGISNLVSHPTMPIMGTIGPSPLDPRNLSPGFTQTTNSAHKYCNKNCTGKLTTQTKELILKVSVTNTLTKRKQFILPKAIPGRIWN